MSLYELVTLASIVEKETLGDGVAENIASVFVNRLNIGQQLQSDVTIFYGNKLRKTDLATRLLLLIILINAKRFRADLFAIRVLTISML